MTKSSPCLLAWWWLVMTGARAFQGGGDVSRSYHWQLQSQKSAAASSYATSKQSFLSRYHPSSPRPRWIGSVITTSTTQLYMVRNIDLVEALIFYGRESILVQDDSSPTFLPGVQSLLEECDRDDTAVIAILEGIDNDDNKSIRELFAKQSSIHTFPITSPAPNPKDLWTAIHRIPPIQPKGFGGSSGFGTKAADPERAPLPKHCVVLSSNENQCRAARYCGMRVLCLTDTPLADAVIVHDWSTIYMDDIATPGSFWLNPPHPRDDESYRVDVEMVIQAYEQQQQEEEDSEVGTTPVLGAADVASGELSDAELAKLLADIDPL